MMMRLALLTALALATACLPTVTPEPTPDGGELPAGDGGLTSDAGTMEPPKDPLPPLGIDRDANANGYVGDKYAWRDAKGLLRTALLVHNDKSDPAGRRGGYLREYTYQLGTTTRVCTGGTSSTHPGWGFTVNHWGGSATLSTGTLGTYQRVLGGKHHALHVYKWRLPMSNTGNLVDATVQWFFANGRTNPVWAVTFDASPSPANAVNADTRAPYGELNWDGNLGSNVDGVGWGDRYRFVSLNSPVTMSSGWDYATPNTVPYVLEWANAADAEMGAVQTQTYKQHDAGGYWAYSRWGMRSDSGPMPEDYNWTYQLNQYELPFVTTSKRLAWGANFGAVGQSQYNAYGDAKKLSGYPYQSYAVFVVLGRHTDQAVLGQVAAVEAVQGATLTASVGSVVTSGPAGLGRTDAATYEPAGWNPVLATWELTADASGRTVATLTPGAAPLETPVLVVHGFPARAPIVELEGRLLAADADYLATQDEPKGLLYLTLRRSVSQAARLEIR